MTHTVSVTFKTRMAAEKTLNELDNIGITEEQLSVVATDETRGKSFAMTESTKLSEGAAAGAALGGLAGALFGSLAAATAVAIPGLNVVLVGTAVSTLAGLGAGATAGGLVGALIGAGIPEHEAKIYENELKNGSILIAVKPENKDQHDAVKRIFEQEDAYHLAA